MDNCMACDLTTGKKKLPGGRIYSTKYWVVEHCVGPLGTGTLILKPFRHCLHYWELNEEELKEVGPLLRKVSYVIKTILNPDQVYICLWSHAGWEPVHIHFVLQPIRNSLKEKHKKPGPFLQTDMFRENIKPEHKEIEDFCKKARKIIGENQEIFH